MVTRRDIVLGEVHPSTMQNEWDAIGTSDMVAGYYPRCSSAVVHDRIVLIDARAVGNDILTVRCDPAPFHLLTDAVADIRWGERRVTPTPFPLGLPKPLDQLLVAQ